MTHTSSLIVEPRHLAESVGSGDLPVLATPVMAMLMENAAMLAAAPSLQPTESTVGSMLNISHQRPTAVGSTITATATLREQEGRKLTFDVQASDEKGIIGEGTHVRFIIDRERFMAKL